MIGFTTSCLNECLAVSLNHDADEMFVGTVVLTPNPAHVFKYSDVEEIWGKKIVLPNVELRRFGLEAGKQ